MLPFNLFVAAAWALDESPFFYPENQVSRQHSNWMSNKDLTISYMAKNLGFTEKEIQISSDFTDHRQVRHVHVTRLVNGVPVANNNAGFHLSNGKVTWTSSFHASRPKLNFNAPKPAISMDKAIKIAEHALNCSKDDTPSVMEYLQISSTDVAYVYSFQLRDDRQSLWLRVSVDVNSGSILQIVDYGSDASYRAIQLPKSLPTDGFELVAEPQYLSSSPLGWHLDTVDTSGNNVDVFIDIKDPITNLTTRERPVADTKGIFESPWNATESPQTEANRNASSTHLFYIANMVHDIMYQFGFNEVAGNFQKSNMGKGGKESDQVLMSNQNNGGKNNANFRTPPDGMNGLCNMYLWNFIEPMRDGSLDTRIPIHELVHGVSNRLTGGSQNGVCLSVREARGMGEGWSDAIAIFLTRSGNETRETGDATIASYAKPTAPNGLRKRPYSTNMTTSPWTYKELFGWKEPHSSGELWGLYLNELYWNLVDKLGFSTNWYDSKQPQGNIVTLQLILGGMMLQPCNPTFKMGRDAIIEADQVYYNGTYKCDIWKAFAKRGLGANSYTNADNNTYTDGFQLPGACSDVN